MSWLPIRICLWPTMVVMVWCVLVQPGYATAPIADPAKFLDQAESLRSEDHSRFVQMLEQIHQQESQLSEAERWHLRYLEAWKSDFDGNYAKSEQGLRQIIDHSGDPALIIKASARLVNILSINRRYEEAFALANHLASALPEVKDPQIRFDLLIDLSVALDFADQIDLAVQYARMSEDTIPPGETLCRPLVMEVSALYNGNRLTSASSELRRAIDACTAPRGKVLGNSMWLVLASLYIDENQPRKALSTLDQVAPAVLSAHYYPHILSSQVERAQAYLQLGNVGEAKKAALAALAISHPDDTGDWVMNDYQALYEIEKKQGHDTAALTYYEKYVALKTAAMDNAKASALAYQTVRQQVLSEKMKADALGKENKILQLREALASQAQKASRLFNALLLAVIAFFVLAMLWLWRSWRRFRWMAHHDGLTRVYNREHFLAEAKRTLRQLHKANIDACLVVLDLDHFKLINDTHGHAGGDEVLRSTAAIVRQALRPTDLLGRLGGEEFGILLSGCSCDQGLEMADRIRSALATALMTLDSQVTITVSASFGLACTASSSYTLRQLLIAADTALYRAKEGGRNQIVVHTGPETPPVVCVDDHQLPLNV